MTKVKKSWKYLIDTGGSQMPISPFLAKVLNIIWDNDPKHYSMYVAEVFIGDKGFEGRIMNYYVEYGFCSSLSEAYHKLISSVFWRRI